MSTGENERLAGRYRLVEQLGRGGMGVVWRAVDEVLGREVAVKELRTYTDSSAPELADLTVRMQREARAAARVRHPGVIAVHDVAEHEGRPVIVMELVDGPSLDDVLNTRGVMDPREAARIGASVLEALGAAHRAGVLHRDVKPGNVLLDRSGRVVLTDFGIAAMDDPGDGSTSHLTRSGEIVGSLDYLAPERAQGHDPGPASDVWALGATLYAAVEGSSPFRRTSTWSTLTAIVAEPLPEPRSAGPLAPVLRQLMQKDPAQRPGADAAARMLSAVAAGEDPAGHTAPLGPAADGPRDQVPPRVPTVLNAAPYQPQGFGPAESAPATGGAVPGPATSYPPQRAGTPGAGAAGTAEPFGRSDGRPVRHGRSKVMIAAAVAAVLFAGGGVTYALVGNDGSGTGGELAGGEAAGPSAGGNPSGDTPGTGPAGERSPTADSGSDDKGTNGKTPPSPSSKAPAPGDTAAGSDAGGTTGGSGSGADGGSDGGASGGSTGGSTGESSTSGGATGGGGTTGGGDAEPAPACHAIGAGKYNCRVWKTAQSYNDGGAQVGVLDAGTNYFYCQSNLGRRETSGEWTNVWWAKTDDDSGNRNVWVSDVYVQGGANDEPVPGLPVC
ncbi:protein kinase [Streptomyces sp. Tu 2975]|uniref:serine/threonine-protein kinase n=1 Tax=Streptomyces sp. Tu 2975 TaxID=2676871 RepID=UPI00135C35C4|nr:serine/threonine-protein kinase [Streptomyces sp. Tu 2975]QIP87788.1 protein kinase [Streptomyces sp. Tu 2975]